MEIKNSPIQTGNVQTTPPPETSLPAKEEANQVEDPVLGPSVRVSISEEAEKALNEEEAKLANLQEQKDREEIEIAGVATNDALEEENILSQFE